MSVRSVARGALGAVLALVVAGCGSAAPTVPAAGGAGGEASRGGSACPPAPVLAAPPRRVVTMDGGAAAILERLGLADRIVGTAAPDFFGAFGGAERARLDRIPVIDPRQGNAEAVIAARPDLVMGISSLSFGGFDGTPTVERLREVGATALVACTGGADAVNDLGPTLGFVEETAAVFGVPERGRQLVERIRADAAVAPPPAPPVRVLALSGPPTAGRPVLTRGSPSLANGVIALAGGTNVAADVDRDLATISAEQVVARDPQAIVVVTGFSPVSEADLVSAIRASPVLATTTAVREGRLLAIPQSAFSSPSVLNGQAVARLATALRAPAR